MLSALGITVFSFHVTLLIIPLGIYNSVVISSYSLSVATTVLSTVGIVIRILKVSRMPGASRQPRIVMEIIIESAVLYSIAALAYTATLSSLVTSTTASVTYALYAEVFFGYMAVESHPSFLPVHIF